MIPARRDMLERVRAAHRLARHDRAAGVADPATHQPPPSRRVDDELRAAVRAVMRAGPRRG